MSLTLNLVVSGSDFCDKCKKPFTDEDPGIELFQSSKNDRNVVYVHIKELQKLLSKAIESKEQVA